MAASPAAAGAGDVGDDRQGRARISANRVLQVVDERLRNELCCLKGLSAILPPRLWKGVGNVNSRAELVRWVDRVEVGVVDGVGESLVGVEVKVDLAGVTRMDPRDQGLGTNDVGTGGTPPALPRVPLGGAGCAVSARRLRPVVSIG